MNDTFSDEDVAQVSLLCPDVDEDLIRHDLSITGNVNSTVNRILDGNINYKSWVDDDDDLPTLSLGSRLKESSKEVNSATFPSCKMEKSPSNRKIPYSRNDFLSDSSDLENDIEILEPPSLKERLLGKSSMLEQKKSLKSLIEPSSSKFSKICNGQTQPQTKPQFQPEPISLDSDDSIEIDLSNSKTTCNRNTTENTNKRQHKNDELEHVNLCLKTSAVLTKKGLYGSLSSISSSESQSQENTDKSIKRKRTPEEIEEKRKQAKVKKEEGEKRKLEREKIQLEKKKNIQIRKIEGQRKKQMGAWGQSLEFMKIVMDPHIINDCGLGAAIFKAGEELKVPCVTEETGLPFTISWKRTVTDWIETGLEVESVEKETTEDEALLVLPVADFVQMVENSKKAYNEEQTTLLHYIQMVQKRQPAMSFTPVVIGLEKYFREQKNTKSRQHRNAVLGQSPETSKKRKNKNNVNISRIDVEDACSVVQLQTSCVVQILDSIDDITDMVKTYTKAVAEKPAKKDRLNSIFSFHEDGSSGVKVDKAGNGLLKVWKQQLLQFKSVSPDIAEAIIAEYPSPQLLMKAYSRCCTQEEGIKLLDDIVVRRGAGVLETSRRIGKEMSRRFYLFFTGTDPNCVIK